jgi:serine/threonine protein kinase
MVLSTSKELPSAPAETTRSGTMMRAVGRCRVLAELGHGGMANVYLAVTDGQSGFNKLVVLKALRRELAQESVTLSMFLDEARVAAQLNHPNVVQTYEVGMHDGRHVMVMEYLEGQSLSQIQRQARSRGRELPLPVLLRIVINALEGLQYAHELVSYDGSPLDLVHRDVSPQNIFVTYTGHVKVLDFGIAKAASSSSETLTGMIKGKLGYMSPEQLTGNGVDKRADIFSMGCVLWAFATGQKLWHGLPDVQIMRHLLEDDVPSPLSVNPDCDPEFARIIEKALARDRDDRYATALELQADLEKLCDKLGSQVRQKEIGMLVAELFSEQRAELRRVVEAQLKLLESNEGSLSGVPVIAVADVTSKSGAEVPAASSAPAARSSRVFWPIIVGLALVAGAVYVGLGRLVPPPQPATNVANPAPAPVQPAGPSRATVRFSVSPPGATLFLDGTELPPGTASKVLPADGSTHSLRAEAKGHAPRSLEFSANGDLTVDISLTPIAQPPATADAKTGPVRGPVRGGRPIVSRPVTTAAPAASPAAPPKADCSSPFFLDADGIKRVRPECR